MGVENVSFVAQDVARLPAEPQFDLITAFDAIHDQAAPAEVLRRIRNALAPGGMFLMLDVCGSSNLEDNVDAPMSAFVYTISTGIDRVAGPWRDRTRDGLGAPAGRAHAARGRFHARIF